MEVRENLFVRLWDYSSKEELEYRVVSQTMKTHYTESNFYEGHYYFKSEQILSSGGNGIETISLRSKLGEAIKGKNVGAIVSYANDDGLKEKFKIIGISEDGINWEEVTSKDNKTSIDTAEESTKNNISDHKSEAKRLKILNTETKAWVKHSQEANHLVVALKNLRRQLSIQEKVPAYIIFYDTTMAELCLSLPVTKSQLLTIKGIGEAKCEKYGDKIIEVIKKYIDTILDDDFVIPDISVFEKHCFSCRYSTDDPRFVFCPICGNKLV